MAGRFSIEAVFKAVDRVTAPVSRMQNKVGKFTRSMSRGLHSVNRAVGKMARGLRRGGVAAVAGLTIAVTALALALKGTADKADALAKRSRRLQFPIEELQEWQFVAEQSGLSTETFDKSLEKFAKTVGEARAGTGTLITILKKANPALLRQLLAADDVSSAFGIYVDALRNTENQMDKTALATAAFGRTGAGFLNITEQSAAAIVALRKEQRENGVITKEQAEAAEAWNDALSSLKKSFIGFKDAALIPLFPVLTRYMRDLREIIVTNRELVSEKVEQFFMSIIDNFGNIVKWSKRVAIGIGLFIGLITIIKTLTIAMTFLNAIMLLNPVSLIVIGVFAAIAAFAALVIWVDEVHEKFEKLHPVIRTLIGPFDDIVNAIKFIKDNAGTIAAVAVESARILGISGDDGTEDEQRQPTGGGGRGLSLLSPQERMARSIELQRTTSTAEVTIKDETGRSEVSSGVLGSGIKLQRTGAF